MYKTKIKKCYPNARLKNYGITRRKHKKDTLLIAIKKDFWNQVPKTLEI